MKLSLPPFDQARVLVAGDLMLDRYWHGGTDRISPEAPVPVVHVREIEQRPGGAGNVALNLAALGGHADLVGMTGDDAAAEELAGLLEGSGVSCHFHCKPGAATITKLRVISRHQQLIRLDFEDGFPGAIAHDLLSQIEPLLPNCGVVVLSDYAKGALRDPQPLIQAARAAGVPVLVDPKGRDFSAYRGADLVTPNLTELEGVAGPCPDDASLEQAAHQILDECGIKALLVTRGAAGMTLFRQGQATVHQPARAREVFDVTGAGDTVIATLAGALAAGAPLEEAMHLSNLAAGIVVGKLGTATVSLVELQRMLYAPESAGQGVLDYPELQQVLREARAAGERIVVTNGCFDILHAGHVAYLSQARSLGDRLLVAVNDDDSVRRLKGEGRPVNPVDQRMAVLAALGAVDWVVPFSDDTPADLIAEILPDVLVKGGDYRPEAIAGHDAVVANGGEVRVLEFLDGCSTSAVMGRIQARSDSGAPEAP
ncbi:MULTISPECIES: bifunctional D-glycero-beta-D-manno-heptose-7-phosphate kinase/D-glycero-beta-D-manno-heptose 1-phosphate adenylyltransferase HldE [unclassified Thioalkalivibrio]|uniref:bifunctional D-glycero-beta-D-manno-heptose-7-phosphate kinase/D-glycero-beta-D-manno-heptose 1-phosphate adenylyltransferase HldE n=1 Tax=unclassified Thioalkalivibrio TaxID=2621013 RepID=UPI0004754502|nr:MULTISPECIES: bifunctional D-glycero-beta-D-manno-heptose-7-phosphate kinase/D-glycero-beta-D-manno-heptose 1-phosphate adenylyltransferase HldE [unclassified Thioalkalivibrio]